MAVSNIVDRRTNTYDVKCDAVFEPSWHDNSIEGSTKFDRDDKMPPYREKLNTTIFEAMKYGTRLDGPFTVYLYDVGKATEIVKETGNVSRKD